MRVSAGNINSTLALRRVVSRHRPLPDHHSTLSMSPRRPRNMNKWRQYRSSASAVSTLAAGPFILARMSVTPDTVKLGKQVHDRVVHGAAQDGIVARLFKHYNSYGYYGNNGFETNPAYTIDVWDTLTLAYLIDSAYATRTVERWVNVEITPGPDNGRSRAYANPHSGLQRATIVERFDNRRLFEFYFDGLTRPVPVVNPWH